MQRLSKSCASLLLSLILSMFRYLSRLLIITFGFFLVIVTYAAGTSWSSLKGHNFSDGGNLLQNVEGIRNVLKSPVNNGSISQSTCSYSGYSSGRGRPNALKMCPSGKYVAGIQSYDGDGGKKCRSCFSHVRVYCCPLF